MNSNAILSNNGILKNMFKTSVNNAAQKAPAKIVYLLYAKAKQDTIH